MSAATAKRRLRPAARSLPESIREFLTPALWKQARRRRGPCRCSRWATQPLVLVVLLMTWSCGDSQAERFETARAFCAVCLPRRRRPGKTVGGYHKALAKLPLAALRAVAAGLRQALVARLADRWMHDGFVPIGCDGSRVECPRAAELERRLGQAGKDGSAPTVWVTALVHLRLGLPWAWRLGKGTASERSHLLGLLALLPARALVVADAGYFGYDLCRRLVAARVHFLLRMSSNVTLYTAQRVRVEQFREGWVYYWPGQQQRPQDEPLLLRLIRVRARQRKNDVWLLTNVLGSERLPAAVAGRFYRWRWENEGQFRAYKRTLGKVKLVSRTVRLVHREAEGSLLAMQLMLAQGASAMPKAAGSAAAPVCSPRRILLIIRQELHGPKRRRECFSRRLQRACRQRRERTSAKAVRDWPRRKPHKPPGRPKILTLTASQKARIQRQMRQKK